VRYVTKMSLKYVAIGMNVMESHNRDSRSCAGGTDLHNWVHLCRTTLQRTRVRRFHRFKRQTGWENLADWIGIKPSRRQGHFISLMYFTMP
jgi:hypothetical protein